jgi:hypothetical protein
MLRQFWNQAYEMYLMQASRQYAIEQVERKFTSADGKQSTVFNERIQMADGSIGLRNDASMLAQIRHKIIISEVQETPTKKMEDLNILNDYLRTIAPVVDSKPATVSYITSRMAELIDPLSSVDKEALKRIGDEEVETALAELRLRRAKIDSEMNMILNPPVQQQVPPQTGEPGPGAPAPAVPAQQGQPINQPGPQAQGGQNA